MISRLSRSTLTFLLVLAGLAAVASVGLLLVQAMAATVTREAVLLCGGSYVAIVVLLALALTTASASEPPRS